MSFRRCGDGTAANPNVREWSVAVDTRAIYLSVLVLGEIRGGAERVRQRDPARAAEIDGWLKQVTEIDGLLAATTQVHGLVLVTRNINDIERTGGSYLDPFAPP